METNSETGWLVFARYTPKRPLASTGTPPSVREFLTFTVLCQSEQEAIDTIKSMGFCFGRDCENFTLRAVRAGVLK
jgi:hypothetical protein